MLTLIEGGFSSGLFDEVKKRILQSCSCGRRVYLIVPEQQTVIAEAEMTDFMPADSPLYFEVTNFTRLANSAFRALGGIANEYCDNTKKSLIMWRVLSELAPALGACASMREIPASLAQKYLGAVTEMQNAGINAERIAELSQDESIGADARLKGKLFDLGAVMSLFKRLLSERYSDVSDDMSSLISRLGENHEFFTDSDIYIDGFTSFTNTQYKLIGRLAARTNVTVALILPKASRDSFEFSELANTHSRLNISCTAEGANVKLVRIDGRFGKKNEILHEVTDKIWHINSKLDNNCLQNSDIIRVFTSKNPFDMCDFVASDIRGRIRSGAHFSDFAIVCASTDVYSGILDMSLKKYSIPSFISYKRKADEFSLIKLIYSAYKAIRSRYAREDVISYAKCGLSGIAAEDVDIFEIYTDKWRINGRRFTDGLFWTMSPYGYDKKDDDTECDMLERINVVKQSILEPLRAFDEQIKECESVREHATVLVKFLSDIDAEKRLSDKARELYEDGELAEAQEYSRLWSSVCTALDSLVEAVGEMKASAESFHTLLKIVFSEMEIGRIPAYADEVTVGSADMLRLYGKKHIYMIGVNEGEFPASIGNDGGYFAERERTILALAGIELDANTEIKNARELFCFCRAMSFAEESLTFIYCESTAQLKPKSPSDAIGRLINMSEGKLRVRRTYEIPASELIWTPESAQDNLGGLGKSDYASLKAAVTELGKAKAIRIAEAPITNNDITVSRELAENFYGDEIWLSQTRIDSYTDCPMKHFCKFTLELTDDAPYEFDAKNIGIFIHAVLESFFRTIKKSGGSVAELDGEKRDMLIAGAAREYLEALTDTSGGSAEKMNIRISRLVRAARPVVQRLCDEVKNSKYMPTFFEMRLSDRDPALPRVPTFTAGDGKTVKIAGVVDRVDTMESGNDAYVRVIDYKTGSKLFSPDDIKNGRNLQMFIYLKAIYDTNSEEFKKRAGVKNNGKILPAGVMYIGTSVNDVTVKGYSEASAIEAVKAKQKCQGMLLDDKESLDGMDKSFTPLKYTKGEISEGSRQYLYTADEWGEIMKDVEAAVANTADNMLSGKIAPMPERSGGRNPCEYCEFKPICRIGKY